MIRAGGLSLVAAAALLQAAPAFAIDPPVETFEIDDAAVFKAAGFKLQSEEWRGCGDPGSASYVPGQIEQVEDLNGDGWPEAVVTESSASCFGAAGMGYTVLTSNAAGAWRVMDKGEGIATFLQTRGQDNFPDLQVGGPGLCHSVLRWDGAAYVPNRKEYEGKAC